MKKRPVVLFFVFALIPLTYPLPCAETVVASDRLENGWCCRNNELFQSSPEDCSRGRGRFFATRREAVRACEPEEIEPKGWCCKNGRVQHLSESDCSRGGGQFFDIKRDANEHCLAKEKGWCCKKSEVFEATEDECRRFHGHYSKNRSEVDRICQSQKKIWCCKNGRVFLTNIGDCEKKHGRVFDNQIEAKRICREEKIGWCCNREGEVFESARKECQQLGGRLFNSQKEANRYCESRIKGWCCKNGEITKSILSDCVRRQGQFFENRNEAQTICRGERMGWCCYRDELFEAAYHDCPGGEGQFFNDRRVALKQCGQPPQVRSLEPDRLVRGEPLTLTLTGQKLRDEMSLDFGPDIFVESIQVDASKRRAEVKIFVEPMAEGTERDVILAYGDMEKLIGKVRVIDRIMDGEGSLPLKPQQINGDKLQKKSPVILLTGSGGMKNADLVVSVKTTNGAYQGDVNTLSVKISNQSLVHAQQFTVGFCLASQINSKNQSKWLGTKKVHFLGGSNEILINIPWQVQTLVNPKDTFIVEVDINDSVAEGVQGETNNRTMPFTHTIIPSLIQPAPIGKPIGGFIVLEPKDCSSAKQNCSDGVPGEIDQINFILHPSAKSHPKYATMSEYVKITLLREDDTELLTIVENARFQSITYNFWYWLIPQTIQAGKYRIYIESTDGLFNGKSELFTIKKPISLSIQKKPGTVLIAPVKEQVPIVVEPLQITHMKIKSLDYKASTQAGGSLSFGSYARLDYLDIYLELETNKSFKFAASLDPAKINLKPEAVWSLAIPEVTVNGVVMPLEEKQHGFPLPIGYVVGNTNYTGYDPEGSYPWETIIHFGPLLKTVPKTFPKGKNSILLRVVNPGVIHGLKVIGVRSPSNIKCEQTLYPVFGAKVKLTYKSQTVTYDGAKHDTSSVQAANSSFIANPVVFKMIDTTKTTKQLGFTPPWSKAKVIPPDEKCWPLGDVKGSFKP